MLPHPPGTPTATFPHRFILLGHHATHQWPPFHVASSSWVTTAPNSSNPPALPHPPGVTTFPISSHLRMLPFSPRRPPAATFLHRLVLLRHTITPPCSSRLHVPLHLRSSHYPPPVILSGHHAAHHRSLVFPNHHVAHYQSSSQAITLPIIATSSSSITTLPTSCHLPSLPHCPPGTAFPCWLVFLPQHSAHWWLYFKMVMPSNTGHLSVSFNPLMPSYTASHSTWHVIFSQSFHPWFWVKYGPLSDVFPDCIGTLPTLVCQRQSAYWVFLSHGAHQ